MHGAAVAEHKRKRCRNSTPVLRWLQLEMGNSNVKEPMQNSTAVSKDPCKIQQQCQGSHAIFNSNVKGPMQNFNSDVEGPMQNLTAISKNPYKIQQQSQGTHAKFNSNVKGPMQNLTAESRDPCKVQQKCQRTHAKFNSNVKVPMQNLRKSSDCYGQPLRDAGNDSLQIGLQWIYNAQ